MSSFLTIGLWPSQTPLPLFVSFQRRSGPVGFAILRCQWLVCSDCRPWGWKAEPAVLAEFRSSRARQSQLLSVSSWGCCGRYSPLCGAHAALSCAHPRCSSSSKRPPIARLSPARSSHLQHRQNPLHQPYLEEEIRCPRETNYVRFRSCWPYRTSSGILPTSEMPLASRLNGPKGQAGSSFLAGTCAS